MPQLYVNETNVPLSIAVWLARDDYDFVDDPNYISATTLLKSLRQIVLNKRITKTQVGLPDISTRMASRMGSAIHGSIEDTWLYHHKECLELLGFGEKTIGRVKINPTAEDLKQIPGIIPIYLEQRVSRKIGKWTVGGKYDFVGDGTLEDFKTTGVFSYMSGSNDWKYLLQGSLYRWLNPELITSDFIRINFIFTDWSKKDSIIQAAKGYPPTKIFSHKINLKSIPETEVWVQRKLDLLETLMDTPEPELPLCEARDLWQEPPTFKYYKNPEKTQRSTANFNTHAEATIRWIEDGRVGKIVEVPGTCKACVFCDAFQICSQKDTLIARGQLKP